jgi:hypothetical protein
MISVLSITKNPKKNQVENFYFIFQCIHSFIPTLSITYAFHLFSFILSFETNQKRSHVKLPCYQCNFTDFSDRFRAGLLRM